MSSGKHRKFFLLSFAVSLGIAVLLRAQTPNALTGPQDPGVRAGAVNAGQPFSTLSSNQTLFFQDGQTRFQAVEQVANGLGATYNSTSCASCHAQPAIGGTSPSATQYPNLGPNPQTAAAGAGGATNTIPFFVTSDGPVREARFPFIVNSSGIRTSTPDGGVHALYTITGRSDATGCTLTQPPFTQMEQLGNLIFRIPTPVFGAGLIENIADATILANMRAHSLLKQALGISGHPNTSGNDGTITRFGWKAQNKSLEVFTGEAYNVEMGVTNELFPDERGNPPVSCVFNGTPEDYTNYEQTGYSITSDVVAFSNFMRFLAPPTASTQGIPGNPPLTSIQNGQALFSPVHCDMCHPTAASGVTGLSNQTAALYSDVLVHHMGTGLADNASQGSAGGSAFSSCMMGALLPPMAGCSARLSSTPATARKRMRWSRSSIS